MTGVPPEEEETAELRRRISELQEALGAISSGGVDAVVVGPPGEEQVYTLQSADRPYRVIVESMGEGAATVSDQGVVLFVNRRLASLLAREPEEILGKPLRDFVSTDFRDVLGSLLRTEAGDTGRAELVLGAGEAAAPVLASVTGLDMDGALVRCIVVTDLTMQKRIDEQLALAAARAEERVRNASVAREVNDTIVQGLVAAEMALDLGRPDRARALIAGTSSQARQWVDELVGEGELRAGMAVRSTPATGRERNG